MKEYEFHEYSEIFPRMSDDEFTSLCNDIKENGYDKDRPIVLYQKKILDGRNRYLAAKVVKATPSFIEYDGDDPLDYVISVNINRRHLNETQRGIIAEKLETMKQGRPSSEKDANLHVKRHDAAAMLSVSPRTVATVAAVRRSAPELIERMERGEMTAGAAAKQIKTEKAHTAFTAQTKSSQVYAPKVKVADAQEWLSEMPKCDLLLTDPPYSTDVDDIQSFSKWIIGGLNKVKDTGHAYVFIGAYPEEVLAYLDRPSLKHIHLEQMLIWTYKNTLGQNPKDRYKLNYQICLYYKGVNANNLNCPITNEQWSVIEMNAPDGRLGDRYHTWQKPIELAEMIVRHATSEGDTVYDPFTCTGTFLLAAGKLGRKSFGCDISEDNLEIAIERGCEYA